jgi:Ca-activated chloride channel homolog
LLNTWYRYALNFSGGLLQIAMLFSSATAFAQAPTFHSDVNLVSVTFSARDTGGTLVKDLGQDDIQVLEDGVPQAIRFFASTADLPLTVGIVVDASDSQENFYKKHHQDVEQFLKDVLGPRDQAFLICFGNRIRLVSDMTNSVPQIMDSFSRFEHGKGSEFRELGPPEIRDEGTALFDSIVYGVREKLAQSDHSRKALIVFSDGEDNSSAYDLIDAIETAQAGDVLVYAIRYTEHKRGKLTSRNKYGMRAMKRLARDTGAADFDASGDADLDQTFRDIGSELRSLYEVAYHASKAARDGTFRKIEVRADRPALVIRSRAGYFSQQ